MKNLITLALASIIFTSAAHAKITNPYVGASAKINFLGHKNNHGKEMFSKNRPYFNLNAGFEFMDGFGVEIGYEDTAKDKRSDVEITEGESVPSGVVLTAGESRALDTEYRLALPYIGVTKEFKLNELGLNKTSVKLMLGATFAMVKARHVTVTIDGVATLPNIIESTITTYKSTKIAPKFQFGARHEIDRCFSVLGQVNYTHVGYKVTAEEDNRKAFQIRLGGVVGLGLGVQYTFA